MRPATTGKESPMFDPSESGDEHLGRRRFNTLGYQVRKLEQRVRALETRLATTDRPEAEVRKEKSDVRGSRS